MTEPRLNSRQRKQQLRAELYGDQNGLCYWCEEPMELLMRYPADGKMGKHPRACTIDHLRDRSNPKRREWAENVFVASCYACNHERDNARQRVNRQLGQVSP